MRRTTIVVPADVEVEIVRDDCPCAPGVVCDPADPFAIACPRRVDVGPFVLLRGTVTGPAYVSRAIGSSGMVSWTPCREGAIRFHDRQAAADLQEAVVTRYGIACAVVPA